MSIPWASFGIGSYQLLLWAIKAMKLFKSSTKNGESVEMKSIDTVIGPNTVFKGTLQTEHSVYIEGELQGELASRGSVFINAGAALKADIAADYVVVHGKVTGNITAQKQLDITATGLVRGDVEAPSVTIAKGGILDGFCHMTVPNQMELEFHRPDPEEALSGMDDAVDDIIVPVESIDPFKDEEEPARIHLIKKLSDEVNALATAAKPSKENPAPLPLETAAPEKSS